MPKYVVDTHPLVWFFIKDARLSEKALAILQNRNQEIVIPTIVLCELMSIARKVSVDIEGALNELRIRTNCKVYPLDLEVVEQMLGITRDLEMHDKIIMASAELLNASIITKDREIREVYSKTIW
jgi:PIN domain nuclease of toxin-antitoxin system